MGNLLCRNCFNNIVDTNPVPTKTANAERRISEIKKERDLKKLIPRDLPEVEKPTPNNPLYAHLFGPNYGKPVDPKKEPENNTPTHNRQTPDGCENESEKIAPNDNDMVLEDLCNDALEIPEFLQVTSNDSRLEIQSSRGSITSTEIKNSAKAFVENVIASAMVMQAEACNFDQQHHQYQEQEHKLQQEHQFQQEHLDQQEHQEQQEHDQQEHKQQQERESQQQQENRCQEEHEYQKEQEHHDQQEHQCQEEHEYKTEQEHHDQQEQQCQEEHEYKKEQEHHDQQEQQCQEEHEYQKEQEHNQQEQQCQEEHDYQKEQEHNDQQEHQCQEEHDYQKEQEHHGQQEHQCQEEHDYQKEQEHNDQQEHQCQEEHEYQKEQEHHDQQELEDQGQNQQEHRCQEEHQDQQESKDHQGQHQQELKREQIDPSNKMTSPDLVESLVSGKPIDYSFSTISDGSLTHFYKTAIDQVQNTTDNDPKPSTDKTDNNPKPSTDESDHFNDMVDNYKGDLNKYFDKKDLEDLSVLNVHAQNVVACTLDNVVKDNLTAS